MAALLGELVGAGAYRTQAQLVSRTIDSCMYGYPVIRTARRAYTVQSAGHAARRNRRYCHIPQWPMVLKTGAGESQIS
jgi:hypothetical protein